MQKFKQQKKQKLKEKKQDFSYSRINPFPKYDW